MKKSNIFIAVAGIITIIWTFMICWFCSATIKEYCEGKKLTFARSQSAYRENHRQKLATPSNELIINGDGTTMLKITQGKELSVIIDKHLFTCDYSDLKNGKGKITFTRLYELTEPFEISIPDIKLLTLENCAEISITSLNLREMKINGSGVSSFTADSCKIGSFYLNLNQNKPEHEIWIKSTNKIDSLSVSTLGTGRLKLDGIAKYKNLLCVPKTIEVLTRSDWYQYLTIENLPLEK